MAFMRERIHEQRSEISGQKSANQQPVDSNTAFILNDGLDFISPRATVAALQEMKAHPGDSDL
jgi:hypothetical protein